MSTTTRIHSAEQPAFAEFQSSPGHRRPTSAPRTTQVVIIGHTGQVGSALAARLQGLGHRSDLPALNFSEGINRSSHLLVGPREARELSRSAATLDDLAQRLQVRGRPAVIVDCTADPELPRHYPDWLRAGIGVVTPNKHGFSGDLALYRAVRSAATTAHAPLGYCATVGAGLPILSTLRRFALAGQRPTSITAAVSGTLAHVFAGMNEGQSLSQAVAEAREQGFTEPDPLEDLSGADVARKLLIMLRESGIDDITVEREPVVADAWARQASGSGDVIHALGSQDEAWRRRIDAARRNGAVWTYLAQFDGRRAWVGPVQVDSNSPFVTLEGSDNRAAIHTAAGDSTIVQGPGAGVEVTADAVLADLIEAARLVRNAG